MNETNNNQSKPIPPLLAEEMRLKRVAETAQAKLREILGLSDRGDQIDAECIVRLKINTLQKGIDFLGTIYELSGPEWSEMFKNIFSTDLMKMMLHSVNETVPVPIKNIHEDGAFERVLKLEEFLDITHQYEQPIIIKENPVSILNDKLQDPFFKLTYESLKDSKTDTIKLIRNLNIKLNYMTVILMNELLLIAASPVLHEALFPEQQNMLLTAMPDVDPQSVTNFYKIGISRFKTSPESIFVNIVDKSHNEDVDASTAVYFPFYADLKASKVKNIRAKDAVIYIQLVDFIFPGINDKGAYTYRSSTNDNPWFDAVMMAAYGLVSRLDAVAKQYSINLDLEKL